MDEEIPSEHETAESPEPARAVLEQVLQEAFIKARELLRTEGLENKDFFQLGSLIAKLAPLVQPKPTHKTDEERDSFFERIHDSMSPDDIARELCELDYKIAKAKRIAGRPPVILQGTRRIAHGEPHAG